LLIGVFIWFDGLNLQWIRPADQPRPQRQIGYPENAVHDQKGAVGGEQEYECAKAEEFCGVNFHGSMVYAFYILVLQRRPTLDQKPVRIIVATRYVAQVAFRHQAARQRTGGTDDALDTVIAEMIGVTV
jgi:hypothetical protein